MGMNEQIREIIELDRQAAGMIQEAEEMRNTMDHHTSELIKSQRDETLQEAKRIAQQNYDVQIQEAEGEKEKIIRDMALKLERVKGAYHTHKEEWAKEILEELLQQEG